MAGVLYEIWGFVVGCYCVTCVEMLRLHIYNFVVLFIVGDDFVKCVSEVAM